MRHKILTYFVFHLICHLIKFILSWYFYHFYCYKWNECMIRLMIEQWWVTYLTHFISLRKYFSIFHPTACHRELSNRIVKIFTVIVNTVFWIKNERTCISCIILIFFSWIHLIYEITFKYFQKKIIFH